MPWAFPKATFYKLIAMAVVLLALTRCEKQNSPIILENPPPSENPDAPGGEEPSTDECFINYNSTIQLNISAKPGQESLEVLDANPIAISSIPLRINGNEVTLRGEYFPTILLTRLHDSVDLRLSGIAGKDAKGTLNPATGEISIQGFQLSLEVLNKGTEELFLQGSATITGVNFSTGSVTATGNLNSISKTGQPINAEDRSLVLVVGLTLPNDFTPLIPLNSIIGGGALTAQFEGTLDRLPGNCGAANPGTPPPGQEQPNGLKVSVEGQVETSIIDFGLSPVFLRRLNGREVLDCSDSTFRTMVSKTISISNISSQEQAVRFTQPVNSDFDTKSPLCNGQKEFLRGSIQLHGNATCEGVAVAGREFLLGECKLPAGDPESSISFPLMYLPNNYEAANSGDVGFIDTADFVVDGGTAPFLIKLSGRTIPQVRDVFSLSKVSGDAISSREVRSGGNVKISLSNTEVLPYHQKLVLKNTGEDTWEEIRVEFENGSGFSSQLPIENRIGPVQNGQAGLFFFDLILNPNGANVVNDRVTIRMIRVGSRTEENPAGIETRVVINLFASVGLPQLGGEMEFQVDFITALIDHPVIDAPLESEDYRERTDFAPAPLKFIFQDTDQPDIKTVKLEESDFNVLDRTLSVAQRKRFLRIFNSRSTIGRNGQRLETTDNPDSCDEPANVAKAYDPGDCSYFYHPIEQQELGLFDVETGHLTLPGLKLGFQNPYHADIFGRWPASNPNADPDYILDVTVDISFTTHQLNSKNIVEGGRELVLVPDSRISNSDLLVQDKKLGEECPQGFLADASPHLRCYLSSGAQNLKGFEVTLRQDNPNVYDLILVGVGHFPSGGPNSSHPDLPWFLGDNGGSRIYIAIQGRILKQ